MRLFFQEKLGFDWSKFYCAFIFQAVGTDGLGTREGLLCFIFQAVEVQVLLCVLISKQ